MPSCVVKWCRSHSSRKKAGVTFHKFPSNPVQREKWVSVVRLERNECDWLPTKLSMICSIHFQDEDMYFCDNGKRKLLKKIAVPICTMVTPISGNVNPSALGGKLSSITDDIDIQEESLPPKNLKYLKYEDGDEANTEQNTKKRKSYESDCSGIPGKKINIVSLTKKKTYHRVQKA
ncbi:uncharacterized protein LOC119829043 [Zerene cesonia]|uniref:uncharacterized protein LOC119829043 n=1 Tax=Zerene cesonia TaxID=33412 RepID=UPI0018E52236|nr:uncharacterized protein LOC119829043 [Zerene cesonia]